MCIVRSKKAVKTINTTKLFNIKTYLDMYAKSLGISYQVRSDLGHEYMKCEYNSILKFIIKMYSLDTIYSRYEGVEIALTLDRARFISYIAHIMHRAKVVDIRARDPKHHDLPLNFQSHEHSHVFKMYLMKGTKDRYKYFKLFFAWEKEISKNSI